MNVYRSRLSARALGLALASSVVFSTAGAEDNPRAFMLASSCAACHGTDGNSPGAIPTLKGKSANFIRTALIEYKTDASESTVMGRLAKGYSDEEIDLIAAWFAAKNGR